MGRMSIVHSKESGVRLPFILNFEKSNQSLKKDSTLLFI